MVLVILQKYCKFFPPSEKLLKGSNLDMLAGEIESVIYPKVQES